MTAVTKNGSEFQFPKHLEEAHRKNLELWRKLDALPQPSRESARFGQVWSTKLRYRFHDGREKEASEGLFVLVLTGARASLVETMPDVRVVPLSYEVEEASDLDLILSSEVNPFGCENILEFWNTAQVFTCNLKRFFGEIKDEKTLDQILELWMKSVGVETRVSGKTGPPIVSPNDWRLDFRSRERRRAAHLWEPLELAIATFL